MMLDHDYVLGWMDLGEADGGDGPVSVIDALSGAIVEMEESFRYSGGGRRDPELARLPYYEYLRTPHWRDTRIRALQRAGYQCKRCEVRGKRLDVHHLTYDRLGRERESDLTVLCESCHARQHMPKHLREAYERLDEMERRRR